MIDYNNINRLLVVDDEEINCLLTETLIRSYLPEASILITSSGEEAIQTALDYKPQLIFMDQNMPGGISGLVASRKIKALLPSDAPYIFILSADEKSISDSEDYKYIDSFIPKPLRKADLERAFDIFLKQSNGNQEIQQISELNSTFNLASLKERLAGNEDMLGDIIDVALESVNDIKTRLSNLDITTSISQETKELLKQLTHKLNGISLNVGFDKLASKSQAVHRNIEISTENTGLDELLEEIDNVTSYDYSIYV